MSEFENTKALLDQINQALASYDPVLREKARDILLQRAFGSATAGVERTLPRQNARIGEDGQLSSFDALLERWTPTSQQEVALLGAYYFNVTLGRDSFSGAEVNSVLKDHGRGSKNITQDLGAYIDSQPSLILQVKKSGNSKQSRKQYKITSPGVKYVEAKLTSGLSTGENQ